jgi:hypothetical protein
MLTAATKWVNPSNDFRRKYERKNYSADIVFASNGRIFQGNLKDISVGGAFILTKYANQVLEGEVVTISIPFTDGLKHVKRSGHVLWKNSTGFAIDFSM